MTAGSPREQTNEQTAGNLVGLEENVSFRKTPCGGNDLVVMEVGCDYGGSRSVPTKTMSMFQIRVQENQPKKMSETLFTRWSCQKRQPRCRSQDVTF